MSYILIWKDSSDTFASINPIRYRSYYYDIETNLYYLQSRYYSPETGRFISHDDVDYLDSKSLNGLNLYSYENNNPICIAYTYVNKKTFNTTNNSIRSYSLNNIFVSNKGGEINKFSTNPLSFSVGLVTPKKYNLPSWMDIYGFYVKGSIGLGYTFGDGYSLASFGIGIVDATFHTPKWFGFLSEDHLANPNIYFGIGAWNANASIGLGFSGTAEIISGTIGVQFGDSISVEAKGYVGVGLTVDITNGIKFGIGFIFGYEISIVIDWYGLFH